MDKKRIDAESVDMLDMWYNELATVLKDARPQLIFNFDESGFQFGQGKAERVISSKPKHQQRIASAEHGENVTVVECVNAVGWSMSPLFILKGQRYMESWYKDVPASWLTSVSPNGVITDEIALSWVQNFDLQTKSLVFPVKNEFC
ncbi:transcriptional regulator family: Centromere protein B DNA-binding region [Penicillium manginii]|jgi:hypothetical protein|uniref:transcriptional regulator family: Centromere protein B DNA-binding region n=1 Tax=Penicillium manginii TaxID=203109 RepID=UPI0025478639|nr:transcriptional regulator family: Centromere protein B DNA-binding region [Penicillium manginii]KAJ5762907.1 transcriptional regulator family: Centromere protein B DNA-binding region [Penicillium manginii]